LVREHQRNSPPAQTGRSRLPTGDVPPTIAYGSRYVVVLAGNGSLWSWGEESSGFPVLGISATNLDHSVSLRQIGYDTDWRSVAVGNQQCLAIKADGSLWGWGANFNNQLGDGTTKTRPTPVPSVPGRDWKQAVAGTSSFGIKNDGTLWAWGNNWAGQLGNGTTKSASQAVQVGSSTNWTKVWGGGVQAVGLQSDGSLWFWGSLTGGSEDRHAIYQVPTRVSPDDGWVDVCFGYFTMFALKSDGTLWVWGHEARYYNPAGDASSLTPRQVGSGNDWQSMSSGSGFYLLLSKKDGSLWSIDASEHRIVKPPEQYKPIKTERIDFTKDIAAYAAGGDNIGIILTHDGEIWTWGNVLGEHAGKDFNGPNHQRLRPEYRKLSHPWQVYAMDSQP
jgi:alpha-tubulin suppressor-like RCC1 family protein